METRLKGGSTSLYMTPVLWLNWFMSSYALMNPLTLWCELEFVVRPHLFIYNSLVRLVLYMYKLNEYCTGIKLVCPRLF